MSILIFGLIGLLILVGGLTAAYLDYRKNVSDKIPNALKEVGENQKVLLEDTADIATAVTHNKIIFRNLTEVQRLQLLQDGAYLPNICMYAYNTGNIVSSQFPGFYDSKFLERMGAKLIHQQKSNSFYEVTDGDTPFVLQVTEAYRNDNYANYTLGDSPYEGKVFEVAVGIPLTKCDKECIMTLSEELQKQLDLSKVIVSPKMSTKEKSQVFMLNGDVEPYQEAITLKNHVLSQLYMPIGVEKYDCVQFSNTTAQALEAGFSVVICGKPGTGKSTLLLQVIGLLPENVARVFLTKEVLQVMSQDMTTYFKLVETIKNQGYEKVVFFFDEAQALSEQDVAPLLGMMEGIPSNSLPTSFMLSLSGTEAEVRSAHPALVREGRAHLFEIKSFTPAEALKAVAFMKGLKDYKYVGPKNLNFSKEVTMAELWSFFNKVGAEDPFKVKKIS